VDVQHADRVAASWMMQPRSLLDAAAVTHNDRTTITTVATFHELLDALSSGFQDIEIVEHLDATAFPLIETLIDGLPYRHQLPAQTSKTRSIRVRFDPEYEAFTTALWIMQDIAGLCDYNANRCVLHPAISCRVYPDCVVPLPTA
jgi:hypothetical protein